MKRNIAKIIAILLTLALALGLFACGPSTIIKKEVNTAAGEYVGKTVILHTNGNIYVSASKGQSAILMMELAGYDIVALGNHEFDFGFATLQENLSAAPYKVLCSNVLKDGKPICDANAIVQGPAGSHRDKINPDTTKTQRKNSSAFFIS